jgi:hypothetical protein
MKRILFVLLIMLLLGVSLTLVAQDDTDEVPIMQISVAGFTCDLVLEGVDAGAEATEQAETTPEMEATEEATEEPEVETTEEPAIEATEEADTESELPVITLGEECDDVIAQLRVARNGTLWIALSVPDEEEWQEFDVPEDEEFEPQFDRRGRFIGCNIPAEGEQVCRITWTQGDVTYVIEIPVIVGNAFNAAQPASNTSSSAEPTSSNTSSGEWGTCGSCSTCGANANTCVTSPEGQCVADPARCDSPPQPMTTEEP